MKVWLGYFLLTQLVEVPIYYYALRGRALVAFGASAITHPVVFWVFPRIWPGSYWSMIAGAEAFAVVVEWLYLRGFKLKNAFAWSLGSNAASFLLARLSVHLFGWP